MQLPEQRIGSGHIASKLGGPLPSVLLPVEDSSSGALQGPFINRIASNISDHHGLVCCIRLPRIR